MKTAAAILVAVLWLAQAQAQETPADVAAPVLPAPTAQQQDQQQKPAPVERRASKPSAGGDEPVAGPLTKGPKGQDSEQQVEQPVNRSAAVGTIRVQTRLVNVALNVVDAKGTPVGGFEKSDFLIFENGRAQKIAI